MVSNQTALDLVVAIRKHVPAGKIPKLIDDLIKIKGNKSFRDTMELVAEMLKKDR